MRVLVTGAAGFLGTHVCEYFKNEGWQVVGMDNLVGLELKRANFDVEKSREHNLKFLDEIGIIFKKLDCRYVSAGELFDEFEKFDLIIHCAAQPAMTIALEQPAYDADNNILSVINMLQIARKFECPFINCSSIHVYGNKSDSELIEEETRFRKEPAEIDENNQILNGEITPLHVSKYATELYTRSYSQMYGLKTANFRFTGMYGERQFGGMDHGWVANFAIRTIKEREITVFGTDKQVRDILYARDAARSFKCWFDAGCPSGTYNIGGGMKNSISIIECLRKLVSINHKAITVNKLAKRQGDLWYFVCDYKKAKTNFGWEPQVSNEEGLRRLCDWVEANKDIL